MLVIELNAQRVSLQIKVRAKLAQLLRAKSMTQLSILAHLVEFSWFVH